MKERRKKRKKTEKRQKKGNRKLDKTKREKKHKDRYTFPTVFKSTHRRLSKTAWKGRNESSNSAGLGRKATSPSASCVSNRRNRSREERRRRSTHRLAFAQQAAPDSKELGARGETAMTICRGIGTMLVRQSCIHSLPHRHRSLKKTDFKS